MNSLKPSKFHYNCYYHYSPFHSNPLKLRNRVVLFHKPKHSKNVTSHVKKLAVRAINTNEEAGEEEKRNERRSFLSLEEAGLVEISGLSIHERFLCRLTISSLNLLRVIAEQEGCSIEELNAGRVCDWFLKDKLKREQNFGSAVLQWDDDDPFDLQF